MRLKRIFFMVIVPIVLALLSLEYIYLRVFSSEVYNSLAERLAEGQRPAHLLSYLYGNIAIIAFILYILALILFTIINKRKQSH